MSEKKNTRTLTTDDAKRWIASLEGRQIMIKEAGSRGRSQGDRDSQSSVIAAIQSKERRIVSELRTKLKKKTKDWLVDRLVELSVADTANADRIMLSLASDDKEDDFIAKFKSQIDRAVSAIHDHGLGTWKSPLPTTGFDNVADALAVTGSGHLSAIIEISEYALVKLDGVFELQDECELDYLVDAFRHLHLDACYKLKPDPIRLGERLARLGQQTEWGLFDGPPDGYGEILKQEGMKAFLAASQPARA